MWRTADNPKNFKTDFILILLLLVKLSTTIGTLQDSRCSCDNVGRLFLFGKLSSTWQMVGRTYVLLFGRVLPRFVFARFQNAHAQSTKELKNEMNRYRPITHHHLSPITHFSDENSLCRLIHCILSDEHEDSADYSLSDYFFFRGISITPWISDIWCNFVLYLASTERSRQWEWENDFYT